MITVWAQIVVAKLRSLVRENTRPILPEFLKYLPSLCDRWLTEIEGSNFARGMDVCLLLIMRVVRSLCVGLITYLEESYRMWCV